MATLSQTYTSHPVRSTWIQKPDRSIGKFMPRRCMLVSMALILAGLSIPIFMLLDLLPVTLLLGFVVLSLLATGGVLILVFCGKI